jgi:DNA repair protein RecO (recombination protein O)
MELVETDGLILKSYALAEADKIVVLLTKSEGLIRGVAKGARRLNSRYGSALEPFSIVRISYFQKEEKELVSFRQIEIVDSYFEKASDPQILQKFSYLAELLVEFAPPHDPNEKLFRMAKICLESATNNPQFLDMIVFYFELWILKLNGYLPEWKFCEKCKNELYSEQNAELQINFQLICGQCQKTRNRWIIDGEERQIYNAAQILAPVNFIEFCNEKVESVRELSLILKRLISQILGKDTLVEKVLIANI